MWVIQLWRWGTGTRRLTFYLPPAHILFSKIEYFLTFEYLFWPWNMFKSFFSIPVNWVLEVAGCSHTAKTSAPTATCSTTQALLLSGVLSTVPTRSQLLSGACAALLDSLHCLCAETFTIHSEVKIRTVLWHGQHPFPTNWVTRKR